MPVIVGVIALVSWLTNKAKEAQRARAEEGVGLDGPGRGEGTVQAEIDRFLREVGGGKNRPAVGREGGDDDRVLVIADEPEPPRRLVRETARVESSEPPAKRSRRLSERHVVGERHLETGVTDHVADHMRRRMDERVERDLGSDLAGDELQQSVASVRTGQITTDDLAEMLSRPEDVRRAVVVSEILATPRGRRVRRGR